MRQPTIKEEGVLEDEDEEIEEETEEETGEYMGDDKDVDKGNDKDNDEDDGPEEKSLLTGVQSSVRNILSSLFGKK